MVKKDKRLSFMVGAFFSKIEWGERKNASASD